MYKVRSLWLPPSPEIINVFDPNKPMTSLTNLHPIIAESSLTLFTINIIKNMNTKICTPNLPSHLPTTIPIWTGKIIICHISTTHQISEGTSDTGYFSEKIGRKVHYTNFNMACYGESSPTSIGGFFLRSPGSDPPRRGN